MKMEIKDIKEIINRRIEQLSKKNHHFVWNMDDIETHELDTKETKHYHIAGRERWCTECARIRELGKLLREMRQYEKRRFESKNQRIS